MATTQDIKRHYHPLIRGLQLLFITLVWLFVLGIIVQVYYIGLSLFYEASWLEIHSIMGHLLAIGSFLIPVLAPISRFPRHIILLSLLLVLLVFLQWSLVTFLMAFSLPLLHAYHSANALFIFMVALLIGYQAVRWYRASRK